MAASKTSWFCRRCSRRLGNHAKSKHHDAVTTRGDGDEIAVTHDGCGGSVAYSERKK